MLWSALLFARFDFNQIWHRLRPGPPTGRAFFAETARWTVSRRSSPPAGAYSRIRETDAAKFPDVVLVDHPLPDVMRLWATDRAIFHTVAFGLQIDIAPRFG